jgi:hypothetical protein
MCVRACAHARVCVEVQLQAFLTTTLMLVSGQRHDIIALFSGKELRLPIGKEASWAPCMCGPNIICAIKLREGVGGLSVTDKIY